MKVIYYNIPSNNRELQLRVRSIARIVDYNIPSNNRELQLETVFFLILLIITYQVITGNYSYSGITSYIT